MAIRRTITVSIPPAQDLFIQACLEAGRYRSTSEIMRAALRMLERDEADDLTKTRTAIASHETPRA